MPAGNVCALARAKLSQYVSDLRRPSGAEKTGSLVRAGYLGSLKTPERGILGNTVQGIADVAAHNVAAAADYLQAVVRSAVTGSHIPPEHFRNIAGTLNLPGFSAGAGGIKEGLVKSVQIMRTGVNPDFVATKFGTSVPFETPILDKAVRAIFNFQEAIDKPFFGFAFQTSLYARTRLVGLKAGFKGEALSRYIDDAMPNATEDMVLGATFDAELATYKNPTVLGEMASDLKRGLRARAAKAEPGRRIPYAVAQVALDLTMPFTRIPSAIVTVAADYSPAGFLKAALHTMDKDPRMQAEIAKRLIKATAGTGLMLWGMKAAQSGNATGSFPKDAGERARWDLEGKGANMVKIDGKWRSVTWLGPMAIPFLLGVNLALAEEAETWKEQAAIGVGFMGKTMTEMTYLTGVSALVGALEDPEAKGAAAVSRVAVPLPAIVGQTAAAVDPVQRQAQTVGEKVQARIPFASKQLPPRLSAFGDTLKRVSGVGAYIDITNARTATDTEITRELQRLKVNPGKIGRQVKMGDSTVRRSPLELNELVSEFGPIKRAVLEKIITDPNYQALEDEQKKDVLENALRNISLQAGTVDKARRQGATVPRVTPEAMLSPTGER
jgi:hypothetical protein